MVLCCILYIEFVKVQPSSAPAHMQSPYPMLSYNSPPKPVNPHKSEHFFPSTTTVFPFGILIVSLSPRSVCSWILSSTIISPHVPSQGNRYFNRKGNPQKGAENQRLTIQISTLLRLPLLAFSLNNILQQNLSYLFCVSNLLGSVWGWEREVVAKASVNFCASGGEDCCVSF